MFITNQTISADERGWSAQNGATRTTLLVVNKTGKEIESNKFYTDISVGVLEKGNHSFVFLNQKEDDPRDRVLFLNMEYGFTAYDSNGTEIKPLFKGESVGGYGNSRSMFAVYPGHQDMYFEEYTYKNRNDPNWKRYIPGEGFFPVGIHSVPFVQDEIQEI